MGFTIIKFDQLSKAIGSRERLIKLYINQALMTPDKISVVS